MRRRDQFALAVGHRFVHISVFGENDHSLRTLAQVSCFPPSFPTDYFGESMARSILLKIHGGLGLLNIQTREVASATAMLLIIGYACPRDLPAMRGRHRTRRPYEHDAFPDSGV